MRIVLFLFFLRLHCVICKNACLIKAFPERGSFKDILKKDFAKNRVRTKRFARSKEVRKKCAE